MLTTCLSKLQQVKRFLCAETFLDFVSLRGVVFESVNTKNGFSINASLRIKESEKNDPQNILFINKERFVETGPNGTILIKFEAITDVELSFTVIKTETTNPQILMDFNVNAPKCRRHNTILGRWHN